MELDKCVPRALGNALLCSGTHSLLDITVSISRSEKPRPGAVWQSHGRRFKAEGCAKERAGMCALYLIAFDATIANKGWFWFSEKRGVEMIAIAGGDGAYRRTNKRHEISQPLSSLNNSF